MIHFEYEATIDDHIAFNLFHTSKSPSLRQTLYGRIIAGLHTFALTIGVIYLVEHELDTLTIILGIVGGLFLFFVYPRIKQKWAIRELKKAYSEGDNKAITGRQVMSLSPEGIFTSSQAGESRIYWSSITQVLQNDRYVFLYLGAVNALAIPKRAFSSQKSLNEFLGYISTHCEQGSVSAEPKSIQPGRPNLA